MISIIFILMDEITIAISTTTVSTASRTTQVYIEYCVCLKTYVVNTRTQYVMRNLIQCEVS